MTRKEATMDKFERTSRRVASQAGRILRDPDASSREKTVAGSALSQAPDRSAERRHTRRRRWRPDDDDDGDA
jgi:hypothetical protein